MEEDRVRIVEDEKPQTHWRSIYVASALSFVGAVQFSLYFSALFPYMKKVDPEITEGFFGITVAIYSLGQVISAPTFGAWSNRIKEVRRPLSAGLSLMLLGNFLYILMEIIPLPKRYILLIGRFIIGMGSGNVALLRSYASTASHSDDRSRAIAFVTCGQAVGMTLGPAFQFFFTPFPYPGVSFLRFFHLNLYTLPAYLACLINVLGLYSLYNLFHEKYAGIIEEEEDEENEISNREEEHNASLPMYDIVAVFVCYATRFVDMFVRTNLETLGSPFAMMMFSLDEPAAVRYVSLAQGIVGAMTLVTYLTYILCNLEQYIHFRAGCILSLILMFLFHFLTYSWPFLPHYVETFDSKDRNQAHVGCNVNSFEWCSDLTAVNIWVYYLSYVLLIGIAFPLLTITLTTLFSRILGPRRQGTQQGIFQSSSAVARMIGPVAASFLYSSSGPRPVWIMEMIVIGVVMIGWGIFYNRMVELRIPASVTPPTDAFGYQNPIEMEEDEE